MTQPQFLRLALPTPLRKLFDYLPPQDFDLSTLKRGVRVRVPFQSRTLTGILIDVVNETPVPYEKLKTAIEVLDQEPVIAPDIYRICEWAADYYHYALGEVLSAALPVLLRKGVAVKDSGKPFPLAQQADSPPILNQEQQLAVDTISAATGAFKVFLLDGVTGSGKTEVYLRTIANVLAENKQVLVLVPEISLTPQTINRFRARFNVPIAALHSSLSDKDRLDAWIATRNGHAKIVIGTRSAIFTPFADLGLIIIDEEHDSSFKQQDRFRYHARDLGIMRASFNHLPIVLGSATPSLESLLNAQRDKFEYLTLPQRAGDAIMPTYELIDITRATVEEGLSDILINSIKGHLAANNQVMLFLNRRGFAPVLYCTQCAWIAGCKRCDARMVYHRQPERLQCHHCDARSQILNRCGNCGEESLQPVGLGTQRLEEHLQQLFPDVPIIRVDRDSTRKKGAIEDLIKKIHDEPKAILLGTQMLAKGHHFPQVTLVGVIDADSGLFSADFRAAEQMGQLLLQVAGRAGRAEKPGKVLIQTRHPEHVLLQTLIQQGYNAFAQALLQEREMALLPPYTYFAVIRAEAYALNQAEKFLTTIKEMFSRNSHEISMLGPVPALLAKKKGLHCCQLLLRADKRSVLQYYLNLIVDHLDKLPVRQPVKWILDVDPVEVG